MLTVDLTQLDCVKNRDIEFQIAFGTHIKKLRDEREWSQEQLAAFSNIDVNQISRIENGKHAANLHTIRALAIALGKYPDELLRFEFNFNLNLDFNVSYKKGHRPPTTNSINNLIKTSFFNKPRSVNQIIAQCEKLYGVSLKSSAVSGALSKLVDKRKLKRISAPTKGNKYLYEKRQIH